MHPDRISGIGIGERGCVWRVKRVLRNTESVPFCVNYRNGIKEKTDASIGPEMSSEKDISEELQF